MSVEKVVGHQTTPQGYKHIAHAILVVGLAAVSVFAWLSSEGKIGDGWGLLAVVVLIFGD